MGEAALKIADRVATDVDKVVMDGIRASVKSTEEMTGATPELADQARRMLYDYTRKLGLSRPEMEAAGIPRGYFDATGRTESNKRDDGSGRDSQGLFRWHRASTSGRKGR